MRFEDFYVVKVIEPDKKYKVIYYTDDINEIKNDYADEQIEILTENEYTVDDYCEITQDLLEDVNAHKYCNKIYEIIGMMKSMHLPDNIILDFAKRFTHHMFDNYGY